jgi:toxin CptA
VVALAVIGLLAAVGALASEMPHAGVVAGLALSGGIALAVREARRPHRTLSVGADGSALLDDRPLCAPTLHWRGPLAFLQAPDAAGNVQRLSWWPDTLGRRERRALRLAVPPPRPSPRGMRR